MASLIRSVAHLSYQLKKKKLYWSVQKKQMECIELLKYLRKYQLKIY